MDKSSLLGDTLWYMKDLQDRIRTLEERVAEQNNGAIIMEDEESSDERGCIFKHSLPEVEARVVDGKSILLKIQCERRKGILVKIVLELEKLNLSIVSTNVAPFGNSAAVLDITIVVEMEKSLKIPVRDVVTTVRSALEG